VYALSKFYVFISFVCLEVYFCSQVTGCTMEVKIGALKQRVCLFLKARPH